MSINTASLDNELNADTSVLWNSVKDELHFEFLAPEFQEILDKLSDNTRIVNMDQLEDHVPFFSFFLQFQGKTIEIPNIGSFKAQYILVDYPPDEDKPTESIIIYCDEFGKVGFVEKSIPVFQTWTADIFKEV